VGHAAHALALPDRSRFRHRPEDTALYQAVAGHWPEFLERADAHGGLPKFVVKEFEGYLDCGRLDRGCLTSPRSASNEAEKKTPVISGDACVGNICPLATAYEALRFDALKARSAGGHAGLIVLLREGLAAWATRCGDWIGGQRHSSSIGSPPAAFSTPSISDPSRAAVVSALANMILPALANPTEALP